MNDAGDGGQRVGGIFLSYRRQETEHVAGRLADRLAAQFGASRVFMDVDSVPPGADFMAAITDAVSRCDAVLAVIGPEWTSVVDEQGGRRLDDPDDFVVLELRVALSRQIPVIPVLVDGASMPLTRDLPAPLKPLRYRNAMRVDAETFRSDAGALLEALTRIVPSSVDVPSKAGVDEGGPEDAKTRSGSVSRRLVLRVLAPAAGGAIILAGYEAVTRLQHPNASTAGEAVRPVWSFETGDAVFSSPTVESGLLYVGSNDGSLYAIETTSGRQRWAYATNGAVTSSPAVHQGGVFVGSNDSKVHAVDAATGSARWTFETGAAMHSSPAVADGTVYIGCRDLRLYAVDAESGRERWRFSATDWFNSSPAVANGMVYIGCRDKNVYALDAASGRQRWRYRTRSTVDSSPATDGGTVWVGGDDHALYALSARDGRWIWQFDAKGGIDSSPLAASGVVYVGSDDANLYAVDATTGRMRWSFATGNGIRSSPFLFRGTVFVGSRDRSLYAVDAVTGRVRWHFATEAPIDDSSPTVFDGHVFVGSLDHRIYCLDARV